MKFSIGAAALLAGLALAPSHAGAQETLLGGVLGGATGAAIGGAVTGHVGGALAGGIIGGAAGAMIGNQAERQRNGYYAYRRGCYRQVGYHQYRRIPARYCY
ncbi:MAG: hypothetical protein KGL46_07120 [Hyphomicrobiales bacterium]|nr:hypothetical protein [Hyphomicrobiales bacterium]